MPHVSPSVANQALQYVNVILFPRRRIMNKAPGLIHRVITALFPEGESPFDHDEDQILTSRYWEYQLRMCVDHLSEEK